MKYQEQMWYRSMQQAPDQANNPAVVEMAMAQGSTTNSLMLIRQWVRHSLLNSNLLLLEQAKVELEKQKLQSDTVTDAAELEIKNKELEMKETAQIIEMLKASANSKTKEEQAELNRESKEAIKEAEFQTKIQIEQAKIESVNERACKNYIRNA